MINIRKLGAIAILSFFGMLILSYLYYGFTHLYIFILDNPSMLQILSILPFGFIVVIGGVGLIGYTCVGIFRIILWSIDQIKEL